MNETEALKKRITLLEYKIDQLIKPDRYLFQRDIEFLNATIGRDANSKLAFYGLAQIAQPSSTGESTGVTVGGGSTLTHTATFTGNNGSTAYTISDIVKHLKNLGLLLK